MKRLSIITLLILGLFTCQTGLTQDFSSTGNFSLSGSNSYQNFTLNPGHTLSVTQGTVLEIIASGAIVINGTIDGTSSGYLGGSFSNGFGPGGGIFSSSAGAGGGSYAGMGGTGGYDSGDPINPGGPVYGTASGSDFDMGSGGGGNFVMGGNGGGALKLVAPTITINGTIMVNGGNGLSAGQCSGGGSGGCIILDANTLLLSGTLQARGGAGGQGNGSVNDSGGGGGGGRIKVFSDNLTNAGSISVQGGIGGPFGFAAPSQPGAGGTIFFGSSLTQFAVIGIPTVSEWGLIFLFLGLLCSGAGWMLRKKSVVESA